MKASDINYYELTDEEIQDYKAQLKIKDINHDLDESELLDVIKTDLNFAYDRITNFSKELISVRQSNSASAYAIFKQMYALKSIELQKYGFRFKNLHGFYNSEELMIHAILIHNPEFLLVLHKKYHTVDRVLHAYKNIGMHTVNSHFKNFHINDDVWKEDYFQKQLNKLKMIVP